MPIRSPRRLYEIETITRNLDDDPSQIDQPPEQTIDGLKTNLFVKIKQGIGQYLGLEPVQWNDPRLLGVFQGNGLNKGSYFERKLGGFRDASYKLIAATEFQINEEFWDPINRTLVRRVGRFRTMSIGFPKGHSVHEFKTFLSQTNNFDKIAAFVTPRGRKIDLFEVQNSI